MSEYKLYAAELLIRSFVGILFLFQGYDKLFRVKMKGVIDTFMNDADRYHVPRPFVSAIAYYTSITEFAGGFLLILGLFTNLTIFALSVDLLMVCFAFSFIEPMWDLKYMFPRLILLVLLLVLPENSNYFSFDNLLNSH